ncbi:MAG: acyltransferase family protein [Pseudomonadota bacterium]
MTTASLEYRADIDGLRGVAVLAVIACHGDAALLPGGFVGVDVFFVISGYLITQWILAQLDTGQFSLSEFFRRRIKRLAPALLVVIAATLLAAHWLLLPADAAEVAKTALASVVGLANVYFWGFVDVSYFAADLAEAPLLHLWSLGVEEQYYLIWPFVLLLAYPRIPWRWLALLALASFVAGSLLYASAPRFVFYMLPTRAGELLLGGMLAAAVRAGLQHQLTTWQAMTLSIAGTLGLAVAFVSITNATPFPGLAALAPSLACACVIVGNGVAGNPLRRAWSNSPLRATGLISYSLYLWHWPLLAFYRYGYGEPTVLAALLIVATGFALATLSYFFVERPARASRLTLAPLALRQYAVPATLIAAIAAGSYLTAGHGFRSSEDPYRQKLAALEQRLAPAHRFAHICQRARLDRAMLSDPACTVGPSGATEPQVLVWGDSNASHYVGVLEAIARSAGFAFRNVQIQSCPPLLGDPTPYLYRRDIDNCRFSLALVHDSLPTFDVIMLAASWPGYATADERFMADLAATATELTARGKHVVLFGKAPVPNDFDRRCEAKALRYPGLTCQTAPTPLAADVVATNRALHDLAANLDGVDYFDLTPYLCTAAGCRSYSTAGEPMYVDAHHLSLVAAREIGEQIVAADDLPTVFVEVATLVATANAHRGRPWH